MKETNTEREVVKTDSQSKEPSPIQRKISFIGILFFIIILIICIILIVKSYNYYVENDGDGEYNKVILFDAAPFMCLGVLGSIGSLIMIFVFLKTLNKFKLSYP